MWEFSKDYDEDFGPEHDEFMLFRDSAIHGLMSAVNDLKKVGYEEEDVIAIVKEMNKPVPVADPPRSTEAIPF